MSSEASTDITASAPSTTTQGPLLGALPTSTLDQTTASKLQAVLDLVVAQGAPDALAAVITPSGTWTGAAGVDGPDGRVATTEDEFAIASISKTFTAASILRLVEQRAMELDQPLATYLDGINSNSNGATVRQALAMRAGLGPTADGVFDEVYSDPAHAWTAEEIVAKIDPPISPPDSVYEYSNPGYKLLGFAIEHASETSLAAAVKQAVLDPVRADRIVVQDAEHSPPQPWALPLVAAQGQLDVAQYGAGGALPCLSDATFSGAAAAMTSDSVSLARWVWQLFAGQILQPESLAQMMAFDADGNGLGLDRFADFDPEVAYGFSGTKTGYASMYAVLPERHTVIVMFVNDAEADVFADAKLLLAAL